MNSLPIRSGKIVLKSVSKFGTKLVQKTDLCTEWLQTNITVCLKHTDTLALNTYFTSLFHMLFLLSNSLEIWFIHVLNTHYCYYELNTLNTNKERPVCN